MFDRKTRMMTIAATIICIAAFTTGRHQASEQPVQNQSVKAMDTKMSTAKLIETPSAENYIIGGNKQENNETDRNPLIAAL